MSHAQAQSSPEELSLEEYRAKSFNVLVPSQTLREYSDMHEPVLEQVVLSPETNNGDVYEQEAGNQSRPAKYALTKQALVKLSSCAGVLWHPTETRRTDDRSDKNYVSYQAVGGVRKSDGTWVFWKGEYDLDFEVLEMEIREQYENKARKYEKDKEAKWWHRKTEQDKQEYIEFCIRRDLLQKRKHKLKLAESGAMNRVIRALLGVKNNYTKKELENPFVVARVVFRPDYSDPAVRKQLTQASIEAMSSIYGPQRGAFKMSSGPAHTETEDIPAAHTILDVEPETDDPPDDSPEPGPQEQAPEEHPQETDFQNADKDVQIKTLSVLMIKKGYDRKNLKRPMVEWEDKQRLDFFAKLNAMPDKDDSPF